MRDGFYQLSISTPFGGQGEGTLVMDRGKLAGVDLGGICYDGVYAMSPDGEGLLCELHITAPPGALLITGMPAPPDGLAFDLNLVLKAFAREEFETVSTPIGDIQARLKFLRPLVL